MSTPVQVLLISYFDQLDVNQTDWIQVAERAAMRGIFLTLCSPTGQFSEQWRDAGLRFIELESRPHRRDVHSSKSRLRSAVGQTRLTLPLVSFIGSVSKPFAVVHAVDPSAMFDAFLASAIRSNANVATALDSRPSAVQKLISSRAKFITVSEVSTLESLDERLVQKAVFADPSTHFESILDMYEAASGK